MIAVVVLTYNRVHLLQQCVENVLFRTSAATTELLIWNNASTDATRDYLDSLEDPRLAVVHHDENIGQNAYARAFARTVAPYMIEVDDDIVDAPPNWDERLLAAFRRIPTMGFLAADLADNPNDHASNLRHHVRPHLYTPVTVEGVRLLDGPTGGGCAMTARDIYERVGGFRQEKKTVFWHEDAAYIRDIRAIGYRKGILADLQVVHAGGPYYSEIFPEKEAYYARRRRTRARKAFVKRVLLRIPFVPRLNRRFRWFEPPGRRPT